MESKWFKYCAKEQPGQIPLICFHHAGGSARAYIPWKQHFSSRIRIVPVQLPARENRIREAMGGTIQDMVKEIVTEQKEVFQSPFALFGHSFGSFFAYETAMYCQKELGNAPLALFVSGTLAPDEAMVRKAFLHLDDKAALRRLVNFEGTDEDILENEVFLKYFIPIVKGDFELFGNYQGTEGKVACPLYAYYGTEDGFTIQSKIDGWSRFTSQEYLSHSFSGGHFYMNEHLPELCRDMEEKLRKNS